MADERPVLAELGRLAASLGPALAPVGYDELLTSITATARELLGAAACSLALLDEASEELVFHVAVGAGAEDVVGVHIPTTQGIAGWVITTGQPIAIKDVQRDPRFKSDTAAETGYVPQAILAMPLDTGRRLLGVIEVLDRRADANDEDDMRLLSLFARQAALAIESSRVFGDLATILFAAAAAATTDTDLAGELEAAAERASGPDRELAQVATAFQDLMRLGPRERAVAVNILSQFTAYASRRRRSS